MTRLAVLFAMGYALALPGCADPLEQRSTQEVTGQLERGVTGQGKLGPIDRSEDDQANEHAIPQTHP